MGGTCSGPRYRIGPEQVPPIVRVLLKHAAELTAALGGDSSVYRPPAGRDSRKPKRRTEQTT